jgi:hypothetical protein
MLDVIEHRVDGVEEWADYTASQLEDIADSTGNPFPTLDQGPLQLNIQQLSGSRSIAERLLILEQKVARLEIWRANAEFWKDDENDDMDLAD